MEIERIEHVGWDVKNLNEAKMLFSDILGITFVDVHPKILRMTVTEFGNRAFEETKHSVAIDTRGFLEFAESHPPLEKEGVRCIHFKVPDLAQAKEELRRKGIRLICEVECPGLKEAVYHPDDVHGIRLCFVEYTAPSAIDALAIR